MNTEIVIMATWENIAILIMGLIIFFAIAFRIGYQKWMGAIKNAIEKFNLFNGR